MRFVRPDVQEPRIADLGVTPYPSDPSSAPTLYACVHSTNDADVQNATLDVSIELADPITKLIQSVFGGTTRRSYSGSIPPSMAALAIPLTSISGSFTAHARLMIGGKVVDDISVPYSCDALGGACGSSQTLLFILALVVLLIIVLAVATLLRRRFHKSSISTNATV